MRSDAIARSAARSRRRLGIFLASVACAAALLAGRAQGAELTYDLRIDNGRVPESMRLVRVKQGDIVRLRWTTDRPLTLHLHGYDLETRVEPGAVGELRFTARATGRFPVHAHAAAARAGGEVHEDTALVYIEVYPR